MWHDILNRIQQMVEEIRAMPYLEVVTFTFNPPLDSVALAAIEARLGAPLEHSIRDFYQQANGFELHWRIQPNISDAELEQLQDQSEDYDIELPEDPDIPFARIQLLPLEEALVYRDWNNIMIFDQNRNLKVEFAHQEFTYHEFARRLRPFDLFSTYESMAFVLEPGAGDPKVLLLGDYYIEWDVSRLTNFETYIEMILATRGIVDARKLVFGAYRGDTMPPLLLGRDYWTEERIPKLF